MAGEATLAGVLLDASFGWLECVEHASYEWFEEHRVGENIGNFVQRLWQEIENAKDGIVIFVDLHTMNNEVNTAATSSAELHIYSGSEHLGLKDGQVEHTIAHSYLFQIGDRYQIAIIEEATLSYDLRLEGKGTANYNMVLINPRSDETGTLVSYEDLSTSTPGRK